jgi:hypothetical protein
MRQLDPAFVLKLAKTIRPATATLTKGSPLGSQFFDADPAGVRDLSTPELLSTLAGATFTAKMDEIEALVFAQRVEEQSGLTGMKRPSSTADVSQIGRSVRVGSGWTPSTEISVTSGAKAALAGKLEKAFSRLSPDQRVVLEKAAQPFADTGILIESLKSILFELLGAGVENFPPATVKTRLVTALKTARPDQQRRLAKALGRSEPSVDLDLDSLVAGGATVTKTGNGLHISV